LSVVPLLGHSIQSVSDLEHRLWPELEYHASISVVANGGAIERAVLAQEKTGGGKMVTAVDETVKYALGPDPAL
jgi:hypothetical protein